MPRPTRYPPLPPVTPVQMSLISSPPSLRPKRPRALPLSTAHIKIQLLAESRPRYPVSYIALSKTPRELKLAMKLATAPREPGPILTTPSNRYLIPTPKSKVLDRCTPLSFEKVCPCPISRRCGNWKPSPPMPKFYSPSYTFPRDLPEMPSDRLFKVMNPPPRTVIKPLSIARDHHAFMTKNRRPNNHLYL